VSGYATGVVPATEVLRVTAPVRELIREGRDSDLPQIVRSSRADGMRSFNDSLAELVETEAVDMHTALEYAPNREQLSSLLKGVKIKSSGLTGRLGS
jgi:twitching motility protein PilT